MEGDGDSKPVRSRPDNDQQEYDIGESDESKARSVKRKRVTKKVLSKGPTMKVNTTSTIQSDSGATKMAEESSGTHLQKEIHTTDQPSVSQLQEEIQSKQLTIHTLQCENNMLKQQQLQPGSPNVTSVEKEALQSLHKKIKEFQSAVNQRDHMIGQLQSRLAETIQQRDELITSSQEQAESFKRETETLRLQLQQSIDMVTNQKTGVNPRDHLELKNKLISLQQDKAQNEITFKQLIEQLQHKTEVHGQLEYKYKQILQKYKLMQSENEKLNSEMGSFKTSNLELKAEVENLKSKAKQEEDDHKMKSSELADQWKKEREMLVNQIRSLEEKLETVEAERDTKINESKKTRDEIQNLMQKLQELADEVKKKEEAIKITQANAEEHLGQQITLIKQQMSDLHSEEISKLKQDHDSEIVQITEEIEGLQKAHEETQMGLKGNITSLNNLNLHLKGQLEVGNEKLQQSESEKHIWIKKCDDMAAEIQSGVEYKSSLEVKIQQERNTWNEHLGNEVKKRVELEKLVETLRENVSILSSELKQESELKVTVESKLTHELQNVKDLTSSKMVLEKELEMQNVKVSSVVKDYEEIKTVKDAVNKELQEIQSQYRQLQITHEELLREREKWLLEREQFTTEVHNSELLKLELSKFEGETEARGKAEAENTSLRRENEQMKLECTKLTSQVEEITEEGKRRCEYDANRKKEAEILEEKLRVEITSLNLKLQQECELKAGIENHLENIRNEKDNLATKNNQLDSQVRNLEEERGKLLDELSKLKGETEAHIKVADENVRLRRESELAKAECVKLTSQIKEVAEEGTRRYESEVSKKREAEVLEKNLRDEIASLNLKLQQEYENKAGIENDRKNLKLENDKLNTENVQLNSQIKGLKEHEVKLSAEVSKLQGESETRVKVEDESARLKLEHEKLKVECVKLTSQLEEISEERKKMSECEANRKKEAVVLEEKLQEEIASLKLKLQEENELKVGIENDCKHLKHEIDQLNARNDHLSSQVRDLEEEKGKLTTEVQQMKLEQAKLTSQIDKISEEGKGRIECAASRVKEAETLEEKLREEIGILNLKLQQENELKAAIENDCKDLKCEKDRLNEENVMLISQIKDLENEKRSNDEVSSYITLLEEQTKKVEEEYVSKCSLLNDKISNLDKKLAEAHKLHVDFDAATSDSVSLKKILDDKISAFSETEFQVSKLEEEFRHVKEKCETIEKDKADIELERDKLMEQYRMMEAELASTMLALDREVQLSTHRRLSDISLSFTKKLEEHSTQTDEHAHHAVHSGTGDAEKVVLGEEDSLSVPIKHISELEESYKHISEHIKKLEKQNKDLINEAEKLKTSTREKNFIIKSLENEKSKLKRRVQEMDLEKVTFKAEQQKHQKDVLEKLEYQKQLKELKLSKNVLEQTLRQQEENVSILLNVLKNLDDREFAEVWAKTVHSVESSFTQLQLKETLSGSFLKDVLDPCEEFDGMCKEVKDTLSSHVLVLDKFDKLQEEKLVVELENVSLRREIHELQIMKDNDSEVEYGKDNVSENEAKVEVEVGATCKERTSLEKELQRYKFENERLKRSQERQLLLLHLEKLRLQSPKLGNQVHSIMQDLSGTLSKPLSAEGCTEVTMRFLRHAVLKNIGGQYTRTLSKILDQLEETITRTLHSPSLDIQKALPSSDVNLGQVDESRPDVAFDARINIFTEKVEQLINVRSTLVDAANELVEQLDEAVTQRMSPIKVELEDLFKVIAIDNTGALLHKAEGDQVIKKDLCIEPYQAFIQEFVEVTTGISEEAHNEKLHILENQKALIQKILEDNKSKLNATCQDHLSDLQSVSSLSDAIKCTTELVSSVEVMLSNEVLWVDQQYNELLTQYVYEQELRRKSHSSKLTELENSLTTLLETAPLEVELEKMTSGHKLELARLKEDHTAEIKRLETQLTIQDNEMLRHLQSLYSDRDLYRRTVGLLSHVTLQLLHYYSVAESYSHKSGGNYANYQEPSEDTAVQQPESISGRVLDLSFLSDCKADCGDDNQLSSFPEDSAITLGLVGKSTQGDHSEELEVCSNSESMLDSTVMSEGLLDDMDKDEQVRSFLTKSYPQLMSILKGRWDRVIVECLEKEVQELTISLQASAGMLKIFMHSVFSENQRRHLAEANVPDNDSIRVASLDLPRISFDYTMPDKIDASRDVEDSSSLHFIDHPKDLKAKQVQSVQYKGSSVSQEAQPSESDLSSHLGDLSNLIQNVTSILSGEDSFMNLTSLKPQDPESKEKIKQLCQMAGKTENLLLEHHHQEGLIKGLTEVMSILQDENNRLDHCNRNLAIELQATKDQLAEYEMGTEDKKRSPASSSSYAAKMESSKESKERVRAALSAKSKSTMDHNELMARIRDLERLLESVVQEYERDQESLKLQVADFSQQLEVADRQLRSSRQFLDEQASEREREVEDLMQEKEKLANQLRERDNILVQHENLVKEVENLERELREKSQECADALTSKKELQVDHKAAVDKIADLRDIISNLEIQLDTKCVLERDLTSEKENIATLLEQYTQQNKDLRAKLEELNWEGEQSKQDIQTDDYPPLRPQFMDSEITERLMHHKGEPLGVELFEACNQDIQVAQKQTVVIEEYVKRISQCVNALLVSDLSSSQSEEDLSERGNLEVRSPSNLDHGRALSPATLGQPLNERLTSLERTTEAAVKRVHDMQMTEKNTRHAFEEVTIERNILQERLDKHVMELAKLDARLDEVRRSDHPQSAELRLKIANIQEDLETTRSGLIKKNQENEELKRTLSDTKAMLTSREEELERLQSVLQSSPSPDLVVNCKQLIEELQAKDDIIETLKKNMSVGKTHTNNDSDCIEDLRHIAEESHESSSHINVFSKREKSPTVYEESQGASSSQPDPTLSTLKDISRVSSLYSDLSQTSDEKETLNFTKEEYQKLCSTTEEVSLLKTEIEVLQKEICSLNDYQVKLEEDYKSAQQLIEARDEEILQLSEEMVDSVHHPLPSEAMQMQQVYQSLEEQLSSLHVKYEEVNNVNIELKEELDSYTRRYEETKVEVEELRGNNESLKIDIGREKDKVTKLEKDLQNSLQKIKEKSSLQEELQNEILAVKNQLEKEKQFKSDLLHNLQNKETEINELTSQLHNIHKEMREKLSLLNKDKAQLEQQYQKEITEMSEGHITREKQLCSDYEERMAAQVGDLSAKLVREKDEAIAHQLRFYESSLNDVTREKNEALQMIEELQHRLSNKTTSSSNPQIDQLCDSLKALSEGVQQELDKSGKLDGSLASYMKIDRDRAESTQPSTRASSVVSDISNRDDHENVENHLQALMRKVHQDGIQVLSLIERRFIQKHTALLDNTEKSLLAPSELNELESREGSVGLENVVKIGERTQLLRQMAVLEEELSKKDREMKKHCSVAEFRLEQERILSNEWKLSLDSEKNRSKQLCEQLRQERLSNVDHVSEITFLRSQLAMLRPQIQKLQEDNCNLRESMENKSKQLETLHAALQAERNNFSCVSKALNDQRNLADTTKNLHASNVKELQHALEVERERTENLHKQLKANKLNRKNIITATAESERSVSKSGSKTSNSKSAVDDLQMHLAVEQERVIELQRTCERQQAKIASLNEQAGIERSRANIELMEEQARSAELTKIIKNNEMEKDKLARLMTHDRERLKQQELRIRELENELTKLESEVRAQTAAHQVASHKVREDDAQLHLMYNQTLKKLAEAEAELCTLQHKIRLGNKDLELANEREQHLQEELNRERMAINRLGLPALARTNNLNEYFELQVKENFELCKSVLRSMDERQVYRQKISSLEDKVSDLTQKLIKAKEANSENLNQGLVHNRDRVILEREISSLHNTVSQKETEISRLKMEVQSRATGDNSNYSSLNERLKHIYGENMRIKSRQKALIWQKQYLLLVLGGYQDSEQHSISRLHHMAKSCGSLSKEAAASTSAVKKKPRCKLRSVVLGVMAIYRMQFMVQRWRRSRRIGSHILFPYSADSHTNPSSPEPATISRPESSNSISGLSLLGSGETRITDVMARVHVGGASTSITGQTPPTRGPPTVPNTQTPQFVPSCRSLFAEQEPTRYDEYIERLDNIHSKFGWSNKK